MSTDSPRGIGRALKRLVRGKSESQKSSVERMESSRDLTLDSQPHLTKGDGASESVVSRLDSDHLAGSSAPKQVAFTRRAYISMLSEVLKRTPVETGGILLGYRGATEWLVVESLDPGPHAIHQTAFFEYDQPYVTHLVNRVRSYYDPPLELLGLWHRHPGSFDRFSGTDDGTNRTYALMNPAGAISGLVNVDPRQRLTLFHVSADPLKYRRIAFSVLDAEESERRAPLRDLDDLVHLIESSHGQEHVQTLGAPVVPKQVETSLTSMAERVDAAVEHHVAAFDMAGVSCVPWSDEQLVDALTLLEADIQAFGQYGVSINMSCPDEYTLELIAQRGNQEQLICQLVLATPVAGEGAVICIGGSSGFKKVAPYASGFLQGCIDQR